MTDARLRGAEREVAREGTPAGRLQLRWRRRVRGQATLEWLTARWVALRSQPRGRLVVLERAAGRPALELAVFGAPSCVARDVLLVETPTDLRAVDLATGEVLWTLPDAPPCHPVPIDGALLTVAGAGAVECWGA